MSTRSKSGMAEKSWSAITSLLGARIELCCLMCGRIVGEVVDGRAVQHGDCNGRLRLERGVVRCCHCGGPVYQDTSATLGGG